MITLWLILVQLLIRLHAKKIGYADYKFNDPDLTENVPVNSTFKIRPSLKSWDSVDSPKKFSITSMVVDHHSDGSWYIQSLHERYSIGWNRTTRNSFMNRPFACNVRFVAVGMETTLSGYETGGTGYLTIGYRNNDKKAFWHGFDKNETNRVHCYYTTNKDTGSEFLDKPKTLGLAIYCPVILDDESGAYHTKSVMELGNFCRAFADYSVMVELHLRPSNFDDNSVLDEKNELVGEVLTVPAAHRQKQIKELMVADYRPHAVCTVQTFRNPQTGPMLYMFVAYYQLMGWRVIIYDRFGFHEEHLRDLIALPGVDYYPYTLYQLAQPTKYNDEWKAKQTFDFKIFYQMELNWKYEIGRDKNVQQQKAKKELADTADQDADKARTYDYARLEYNHLDTMLYVDADELFFCPQYPANIDAQRRYQQKVMTDFQLQGIEEMRFVRIPYSGMAPTEGFVNNQENRSNINFENTTLHCMLNGYEQKSLLKLVECWSSGTSFDNFPKSADLARVCPFHYNHWSCDGMKGGGRDFTKRRCRCKVGFDMQNGFEYKPFLKKCHLMHFNDHKYKFQSKRSKHVYDKGDVTQYSPLVKLLLNYQPAPPAS